jgi:hypothetical protein
VAFEVINSSILSAYFLIYLFSDICKLIIYSRYLWIREVSDSRILAKIKLTQIKPVVQYSFISLQEMFVIFQSLKCAYYFLHHQGTRDVWLTRASPTLKLSTEVTTARRSISLSASSKGRQRSTLLSAIHSGVGGNGNHS